MKRFTWLLSLGLGILMFAGCGEVKRKAVETERGLQEHVLSKGFSTVQDKGDEAVNKGADAATGGDKKHKDRDAFKDKDDDDK